MWNDPGWAFGVAFIILAISLRKALPRLLNTIADRQSGRLAHEPPGEETAGALEEVHQRLAELEDRVDFTERLLARQREAEGLAPPKS